MTEEDNLSHFKWCWKKTIENFKKENIYFTFKEQDYDYFERFFYGSILRTKKRRS